MAELSNRTRCLRSVETPRGRCVVYVMARDQRVSANHALYEAQQYAIREKLPLAVVFCVRTIRQQSAREHYEFMFEGLVQVENELQKKQIPFVVLLDEKGDALQSFIAKTSPMAVFFDFSPLRGPLLNHSLFAQSHTDTEVYEVDTHNSVPVWQAYPKQAIGARVLRPHIHRMIEQFRELPSYPSDHHYHWTGPTSSLGDIEHEIHALLSSMKSNGTDHGYTSGEAAAHSRLADFLSDGLQAFGSDRNDPTRDGLSGLSPYLHYGQISSIQVINAAQEALVKDPGVQAGFNALFEEMLVRKDLSDNFCYYNGRYDRLDGAPEWALRSLQKHQDDVREHLYDIEQLETAQTHDTAWNAAQRQLTRRGKIHGYMRMYWAKKVLEWSPSATVAHQNLIYLNDFYHLDGRDPNGYVGILWSVAGLHDRPWRERPIFGVVRYMVQSGLKKKFDLEEYVRRYDA